MTQKKDMVKTKAGAKNKDIELSDAMIRKTEKGGLQTVILKDSTNNFFIESKDANIHISFSYGQEISITAYVDGDETEIKKLKFESVTKGKILKIKLNKLLDGISITDRKD